jgi:hypothetical protein
MDVAKARENNRFSLQKYLFLKRGFNMDEVHKCCKYAFNALQSQFCVDFVNLEACKSV